MFELLNAKKNDKVLNILFHWHSVSNLWDEISDWKSILKMKCISLKKFQIAAVYLSIYLSIWMSVWFFLSLSVCLIYLSIYLSISLSIYIYCHPQTDCFILSELFSVARHIGHSKPGLKPIQLYVRLSFRPLGQQAYHVWLRELLRYLCSNSSRDR